MSNFIALYLDSLPVCEAICPSQAQSSIVPVKTPEIVICPCCETREATESLNDHMMIILWAQEISTDEGLICAACQADQLARFPEETAQEQNERLGYIPCYADEDTRRVMWTCDGLYDIDDDQYDDMELTF